MRRIQHRLAIWMNGIQVGFWERQKGEERLTYLPAWAADEQGRALSLSLPFLPGNESHRGEVVRNYFDNLLPDSEGIRRRLAIRYQAKSTEPFDLLTEAGRDCAGAIQLLKEGEWPQNVFSINQRPLCEAEIAAMLRNTGAVAFSGESAEDADLRLSIAGAQEKTALLWHNAQWCLPAGNTPTTHIFKLPMGLVGNMRADMSTSIENEWLCSLIVAEYGLSVAKTEIARFDDQKALVVERFDRRLSSDGKWWVRLPQEDLCQAMGVSPLRKYQADGGPGITDVMTILSRSEHASKDRYDFFKAQIVFWILAATDGHAKNFSLAHLPQNRYHLTPLYDILSAWPVIGRGNNQVSWQKCKLAMAVRGSGNYYLIHKIQRRHWIKHGELTGLSHEEVNQIIDEVITATPKVIDRVANAIASPFPQQAAESIFNGMMEQCGRLTKG
ncbi:type II toxin-antitoxin system HipA family toxin [Enterobacteriaceae bacterium H11S18]|uniref:type II toxin-antitoxin system HipA family toxin n=1 Tax=Dryocola clanedunensis TaxID=2925396 RepID=UPI0022F0318C|nr:type II toxin-antitoxin system HipA family toxin [Dryocola clanedunensis]MCT4709759.1 type II toxin-antitoxin system HipA family toxin [Dryocola clanedunensis]